MEQTFIKYLPRFVRNKLEGRHILQRTISNTGWLFLDRVVRLAIAAIINIWVARYLGPEQFGILNYAIAFVALFNFLSSLGLDTVVIRNLVRDPARTEQILGSTFILKLAGGIATTGITMTAVALLRPGDGLTLKLVGILAAGTIFQSVDTIDIWLQSRIQSRYAVYAKGSAFLLTSLTKGALIFLNAPLLAFAVAATVEVIIGAAGLLIAYTRLGLKLTDWSSHIEQIRHILSDSWSLALSAFVVMIYMKIDQVMLGQMVGQDSVGIYSAAVTLSESLYFIPTVIVSSSLPAFVSLREISLSAYKMRLQQMHDILSLMAFFTAVLVALFSDFIVRTLFGATYLEAATILNIHIWACLLVFPGNIRANLVAVENEQRIALIFRSCGAVLNIALNYLLIPKYGGIGAAWATLASYFVPVAAVAPYNAFIRMTVMMTLKSYVLPLRYAVYGKNLYKI